MTVLKAEDFKSEAQKTPQGQMLINEIRSLIGDWGYSEVILTVAKLAYEDRNQAEKEEDHHAKSSYGNLVYKLLKAVQEHEL